MQKNVLLPKQLFFILSIGLISNTLLLGDLSTASNNSWLCLLFAALVSLPLYLCLGYVVKSYPGKDFFCILKEAFGKLAGNIIIVLFVIYLLLAGSMVISSFSAFLSTIALPETPKYIMELFYCIFLIYIAKKGAQTMGRLGSILFILLVAVVILVFLLLIGNMHLLNLLPVLENGITPEIGVNTLSLFSMPFMELILFIPLFCQLNKTSSTKKILLSALGVSTFVLLLVVLKNILVLGTPIIQMLYFPYYSSIGTISIGGYLEQIEAFVFSLFVVTGVVKSAVCAISAARGLGHLMGGNDSTRLEVPAVLLMVFLASVNFPEVIDLFSFRVAYPLIALPFQVLLPLVLFGVTFFHNRRKKLLAGKD